MPATWAVYPLKMAAALVTAYLFVLLLLAVYGLHRLALLYLYYAYVPRTVPTRVEPLR